MFAVFDVKAEAYLQPFFAMSTGVALRMFEEAASDKEHAFHKHAEDYTLFKVGEFHQDNGQLVPTEVLIPLGNAMQFRKMTEPYIEPRLPGVKAKQAELTQSTFVEEEVKSNGS